MHGKFIINSYLPTSESQKSGHDLQQVITCGWFYRPFFLNEIIIVRDDSTVVQCTSITSNPV